MGKYVDNRVSAATRAKMTRRYSVVDSIARDNYKPLTDKQVQKSRAQAQTDGSIQARIVAEREARIKNNNEE